MVRSKVNMETWPTEAFLALKKLKIFYTEVALIFSVGICQAIYEAQVKTLASILMEWIYR